MPNIHLSDFSGPLLQIIRNPVLRCVGRCSDVPAYSIARHAHPDTAEILYIVKGQGHTQVDGINHPLTPGTLAIYNPGVEHAETFYPHTSVPYFYHFKFNEFVISGLQPSCLLPGNLFPTFPAGEDAAQIETLMRLLFTEVERHRLGSDQIAQSLLLSIMLIILRILDANHTQVEKAESDSLIVQIQRHLERHFAQNISMREVADQFHINYYYLSHLFKNEIGISPASYVNALRINEACRLLSSSKLPIYRVAELVGYGNQSTFQIQFKQRKGVSPMQYRAYYQNNDLMVSSAVYSPDEETGVSDAAPGLESDPPSPTASEA